MTKTILIGALSFLLVGCGEQGRVTDNTVDSTISYYADNPMSTNQPKFYDNIEYLDFDYSRMMEMINEVRSTGQMCGTEYMPPVKPLGSKQRLIDAGTIHLIDLSLNDLFSHYGSGTETDIYRGSENAPSLFYDRIRAFNGGTILHSGENIAGGQTDIDWVFSAWMESPGHCQNIMNSKYNFVGISAITDTESTYGVYWAQEFSQ